MFERPFMTGIEIPNREKLAYVPQNFPKVIRVWRASAVMYNIISCMNGHFQTITQNRGGSNLNAFDCGNGMRVRPISFQQFCNGCAPPDFADQTPKTDFRTRHANH